jgi:cytochrome P450
MDTFAPVCRGIVAELVRNVLAAGEVEMMADFALPFAVRVQCAFLGWPVALHEPLVNWTRKSAQATLAASVRDGRAFEDPDSFRLGRDPASNLLYGAGIHVCPGAPLARMELRIVMEELLEHTTDLQPAQESPAIHAIYPASGFAALPLRIT